MSLYLVKEAEVELNHEKNEVHSWGTILHWDDAYTNFTDEELDQAFHGEPTRKKLGKLGERLWFGVAFSLDRSATITKIFAEGDGVDYLQESHQNMALQLIVNLRFEDGFTVCCKMDPYWYTSNGGFEGRVNIHPTKTFVAGQTYRCHVTVEVIDKAGFNFLENSDIGPFNKKLLEEKRFSDFAIVADNGAAIQCHKHFLAARSPVFDRMLNTNCIETKENRYKMDVSEAVVNAFLQFVYCSDLKDVFESPTGTLAVELMELGHKYDIPQLEESTKKMLLNRDAEWLDGDAGLKLFHYSTHKEGDEYRQLADKGRRVLELQEE